MSDNKWEDPTKKTVNPRYILMSLAAVVCIAAGVFGYISDMPQFAEVAGEYQNVLRSNWVALISAGVIIGTINLVLTLKRR